MRCQSDFFSALKTQKDKKNLIINSKKLNEREIILKFNYKIYIFLLTISALQKTKKKKTFFFFTFTSTICNHSVT